MDTGNIIKKNKMDKNIENRFINDDDFSYLWFYDTFSKYLYLKEIDYRQNTKIYKIDIETFELSEVFSSSTFFHAFFVNGNDLYLMNNIHDFDNNENRENIYILKRNLLNGVETIINFNETLQKNEQINPYKFFITENKLIMLGHINNIALRKIYQYDMESKIFETIDYYVAFNYAYFKYLILYEKFIAEEKFDDDGVVIGLDTYGSNLIIYNLNNNNTITLPYEIGITDYIIVDENIIIYTDEDKTTKNTVSDLHLLYRDKDKLINFYVASINKNKKKMFFSCRDELEILGIMDEI
jgi:hypothetical protein